MKHQEEYARYWRQWLRERGVTEAVTRDVGGAVIGTLATALFSRRATRRRLG
jgi:hypothetical protein